ncbi:NAD-dependent epimerase/dehydratase [Tenacibaculum litopenaei]|uniref:NAD-dependent epimerase/dehydratase family protein n=1 Tax=Tenacibaculum litopenaei TaxID=396016 RepID=UPI00389567EB
MGKVFISGVTGFVGTNLKEYLKVNFDVQGVSRTHLNNNITYEELTPEILSDGDAFVHLAGKAHDLKNVSRPNEYFDVNTELTKEIFEHFLTSSCQTFIYVSSVKAVADTVDGVLTEEFVPEPLTPYGQSKLAAEEYLMKHKKREGKNVYVLRPCMIHGPGNKGNLNLLYTFVNKGIPYPLGKFENKRSFVSVDNLCFIIEKLMYSSIDSGIFNVADDEALSTLDLVSLISGVIGRPLKRIDLPKGVVKALARLGDIVHLPVNSHRLDKLTENYVVSNRKIKEALDIELPISTKAGLHKTIKSFR